MLHLLNATSLHGPSQRLHFLKHCARENAFDTSVIVIHHTLHVCLQKVCGAILINATSPQCYMSSRTWQDESYVCWASKDVKPFPPRILHWSLVVFFGRSSFFLRNGQNLISLKQSFVIRSAADQTVADRLISAPRNINFVLLKSAFSFFWSIAQERTLSTQVL